MSHTRQVVCIDNNWRLIYPVGSSNYVLNPSAETTGNFAVVSGSTVTRSTTYAKYGLYSYLVQPVAIGDGIRLTLSALTNVDHFVTFRVRGNTNLSVTVGFRTKPTQFIEKIDDNWDLHGLHFSANESFSQTNLDIKALEVRDFYIDGIQCEPLPQWSTYIDGTQPGCEWLGAQHASISQRSSQSRAGGYSHDLFKQYGFFVEKVVGTGASPKNLNIDSYSILPGGQLNNVKTESRDFTIVGKFFGDSEVELHDNRQALLAALLNESYPANQPVLLRYNGARVQKETGVFYKGGLEADLDSIYAGKFSASETEWTRLYKFTEKVSIDFSAPDPYWYEVGESAATLDTNDSATFRFVAGRLRSTGQWNNLGPPNAAGTYNGINAFTEDDTYIYIAGNFLNFDNIANADYIVRYHKQNGTYSALGTGTNGEVASLIIGSNNVLYVGGNFTTAGGGAANRIAAWDISAETWSALGSGMDASVDCLAWGADGTLYAGGIFTTAGGGAANRIASWNGSAWSALGSGLNLGATELAITADGSILYVGGTFTTAGGSTANRIAQWSISGSSWSAVGSTGLNNDCLSIVLSVSGILYLCGTFTTADGITVNRVASWNGTSFSALGSGLDGGAFDLAVGPDEIVYVVGNLSTAGGVTVNDMARWNGYAWAHMNILLSSGQTEVVYASPRTDPVISQNYDIYIGSQVSVGTDVYAGLVTVTNAGSVPVNPKIIFNRSGGTTATLYDVRNERTAKELLFNYSLLNGETLTVDLNPLNKSIVSSLFGARLSALLPNSDFGVFSILPGGNWVTSFISTTGGPTITAYMLWRDAYDGYD